MPCVNRWKQPKYGSVGGPIGTTFQVSIARSIVMSKTLAGKVALVTGGARGIGAATARALAEQGADVAISYAASEGKAEAVVADLKGTGVRAVAIRADQSNSAQVEQLVKSVVDRFGRLDILVNNAGVFEQSDVSDYAANAAKVDRQFAVNVSG